MIRPLTRPPRLHLVFLASVLLHVAAVFAVGHYRAPTLWENGVIAGHYCAGEGLRIGLGPDAPPVLTAWQSPLYPLLLCAGWLNFGGGPDGYLAISLLQAVALASIVYPIVFLTRRWFDDRTALVAMLLAVLSPLYLWYATRLHQAGFAMTAHVWLLWLWIRLRDLGPAVTGRSLIAGAAIGLVTGVGALIQPTLLGTLGLLASWSLVQAWRVRAWGRLATLLVSGLFVLVALTPWTVRNHQVFGVLVPVRDSFGKEFWMGNNPHATGTGYLPGGDHEVTFSYPPRVFAHRATLNEQQVMQGMLDEGMAYVKADPAAFVRRTARKIWWFWTATPRDLLRRDAQQVQTFVFASWLALVTTAAIGLIARRTLPREYVLVLAIYAVLYSALYGVTHVGQVRYRGEIEFLLLPLAAAGLLAVAGRLTRGAPAS